MNIQITNLLNKKGVIPSTIGILAFVGGTGLGYILGKRRTKTVFIPVYTSENDSRDLSTVEIEQLDDGSLRYKEAPQFPKDPELEKLLDEEEAIERRQHLRLLSEETQEPERVTVNIFSLGDDGDWDYEAELSARDPELPYILHEDEYINDEMGYRQDTVTYYEGDDIVADSTDTPIYNHSGIMGEFIWGHGCRDRNIVYIRNEKLHMEWEVLRHTGSFTEEVQGLVFEKQDAEDLKHSVQKFRRE